MSIIRLSTFALLLVLGCSLLPASTFAASAKPTCTLTVDTPRGDVSSTKSEDVLVLKGEGITLSWKSTKAKKATNEEGDAVALSGSKTITVSKDADYRYRFMDGSRKVDCSVSLTVVEGGFDTNAFATTDTKPTLTGEVSGTKTVKVVVEDSKGKTVFTSKNVKVKKGEWNVSVTKKLALGEYSVTLYGDKALELNTIGTSTLSIRAKGTSGGVGTLSISSLPLLSGGNAGPGASIPVAYIKVANPGKVATSIKGFTLVQNGSAPTKSILSFATNDDKGGSRSVTSGATLFKNGSAFVPLEATIDAGTVRIYTIKAALDYSSGSYAGQTLMLDVASVSANATVPSAFPIRGTTWVLTR